MSCAERVAPRELRREGRPKIFTFCLLPTPGALPSFPVAFARSARTAARTLAGLAFPTLCAGCDRRLAHTAAVPLCPACLRRLTRATPGDVAARLAETPRPDLFEQAVALWVYDAGGTVQRLQHALKYRDRPALGPALGALLGGAIREAGAARYDAVVPIPLSRARQLERGYNQSALLAEGVAHALPGKPPVAGSLLVRARPTRSQTALSRARRWENVDGAFALADSHSELAGQRLLLVDDVLTTGATVTAAAVPLTKADATVDLAAFALATV